MTPRRGAANLTSSPSALQLADLACARSGHDGELCILLPTDTTAQGCATFLASLSPPVASRVVPWAIHSTAPSSSSSSSSDTEAAARNRTITVHACFFPADDFSAAKQYWQHTGEGVSSRLAERCLILLGDIDADGHDGAASSPTHATPTVGEGQEGATRFFVNGGGSAPAAGPSARYGSSKGRYQVAKGTASPDSVPNLARPVVSSKLRYSTSKARVPPSSGTATPVTEASSEASGSEPSSLAASVDQLPPPTLAAAPDAKVVEQDEDVLARYVEERYGRNLDLSLAPLAKLAMRRRIAGVLCEQPGEAIPVEKMHADEAREESTRGVVGLTEDDVWLYPCGMNAIFHAHQLAMAAREKDGKEVGKSVCFGCVPLSHSSLRLSPC